MNASSSADGPAFRIEPESAGSEASQFALQQYSAELAARFPYGFDLARGAPSDSADFAPPKGVFLVVREGGEVMGCGGLRSQPGGIGEIKRMWISPRLRGQGAGRAMLAELEKYAAELGCQKIRLDTAAELKAAQALYLSAGYQEVAAYNDNEYASHWYEKTLQG